MNFLSGSAIGTYQNTVKRLRSAWKYCRRSIGIKKKEQRSSWSCFFRSQNKCLQLFRDRVVSYCIVDRNELSRNKLNIWYETSKMRKRRTFMVSWAASPPMYVATEFSSRPQSRRNSSIRSWSMSKSCSTGFVILFAKNSIRSASFFVPSIIIMSSVPGYLNF